MWHPRASEPSSTAPARSHVESSLPGSAASSTGNSRSRSRRSRERHGSRRQPATVGDEARAASQRCARPPRTRDRAQRLVGAHERRRVGIGAESPHVVEQTRMVVGLLDDRRDRPMPRMRSRHHRFDLALEVLETVVEHLDQLEVEDRVQVHHLHHVTDDRVAVGEQPDRVDHRDGIVEDAQQLVEAEGDAALRVVIARGRSDQEAQHVEAAEQELEPRRTRGDHALALERGEPALELAAVRSRGAACAPRARACRGSRAGRRARVRSSRSGLSLRRGVRSSTAGGPVASAACGRSCAGPRPGPPAPRARRSGRPTACVVHCVTL